MIDLIVNVMVNQERDEVIYDGMKTKTKSKAIL